MELNVITEILHKKKQTFCQIYVKNIIYINLEGKNAEGDDVAQKHTLADDEDGKPQEGVAAGVGVAMGNAGDNLKQVADYITTHVDEDQQLDYGGIVGKSECRWY